MALVKPLVLGNVKRLFKGMGYKKLPLIAGHKLLYTCNLRCKMCPFWRRKDEKLLSIDEEVKIMDSLKNAGVLFLGFEGGEPLLRSDIDQILMESNKRFHTSLVSNGWLLKDKVKKIEDYVDHVFVSLDGIGDVHDSIRGVKGSFERAVNSIKECKARGLDTSISFTLTKDNLNEALDMVRLAEKLGVTINIQVAYDYSTAERMSPEREKLREILVAYSKMKEGKEGRYIINSKDYFIAILNSWYGNLPWICKPWITINIDPQGRIVLPCYTLSEYSGSKKVWEVDIIKIWEEFDWEKYYSCNKCALSCYLEPSLFSWKNTGLVKERIIEPMINMIGH
ncbi:PTO1314 family radical SAM protein [Acidianus manzaensis]|uniref:Radical SAM protein n=1 Tax=Acidianus manzaensis TaxID=282676 RepID=A0A1W6K2B7_9CREN|nr:PTO1314 family radical SAM protein [Acidianus manzaensis]ARM76602.1 radical SAM protein [Acidianus manzaensis]